MKRTVIYADGTVCNVFHMTHDPEEIVRVHAEIIRVNGQACKECRCQSCETHRRRKDKP